MPSKKSSKHRNPFNFRYDREKIRKILISAGLHCPAAEEALVGIDSAIHPTEIQTFSIAGRFIERTHKKLMDAMFSMAGCYYNSGRKDIAQRILDCGPVITGSYEDYTGSRHAVMHPLEQLQKHLESKKGDPDSALNAARAEGVRMAMEALEARLYR